MNSLRITVVSTVATGAIIACANGVPLEDLPDQNIGGSSTAVNTGGMPVVTSGGMTGDTGGMTVLGGMGGMTTSQGGTTVMPMGGMPPTGGMTATAGGMLNIGGNPFLNMGGMATAMGGMANAGMPAMAGMGGTDTGGQPAMGGMGGMPVAVAGMPNNNMGGTFIIRCNRDPQNYVQVTGNQLEWTATSEANAEIFERVDENNGTFKLRATSSQMFIRTGANNILTADTNNAGGLTFEFDAACGGDNCTMSGACQGIKQAGAANYVVSDDDFGNTLQLDRAACSGTGASWEAFDILEQ